MAGAEPARPATVGVVHSGQDRGAARTTTVRSSSSGPGDAYEVLEPGHDAWVVGDERFVGFKFEVEYGSEDAKG